MSFLVCKTAIAELRFVVIRKNPSLYIRKEENMAEKLYKLAMGLILLLIVLKLAGMLLIFLLTFLSMLVNS